MVKIIKIVLMMLICVTQLTGCQTEVSEGELESVASAGESESEKNAEFMYKEILANTDNDIAECFNDMLHAYQEICTNRDVKKVSLLYFDADSIPELLILEDGKYMLYTYDGTEAKEIIMPATESCANAYGLRHNFEDSDEWMFYWFEYVPYKGLVRVHGGDENARHDYYLKYENGVFVKELEAVSCDYVWYTYAAEKEIESKAFV